MTPFLTRTRFISVVWALASLSAALPLSDAGAAKEPAYQSNTKEVKITVNDATIVLRPMGGGTIRVQIAVPGVSVASESVVLLNTGAVPRFSVHQTTQAVTVDAGALRAVVDRQTGVLRFTDAAGKVLLEENAGSRVLPSKSAPAEGTRAEDAFISPEDEHLFGTGEFQDGHLNVRGLPRRLTHVNTQIAIPFLLSSRGYGLLWHNYGMTDLNPADTAVSLTQTSVGAAQQADVTTSSGTQTQRTQDAVFSGEFEVKAGGSYAFMLDVGQKMAKRYHVEIDGKTEVDFANYWLPLQRVG